ncbi:MAG: DUF362 domain-containing protein [Spirochaetota bacterium]
MAAEKISRREFLKRAILGATVLAAPPSLLLSYVKSVFAEPRKSPFNSSIVAVTHSRSVDSGGVIEPEIIRVMVSEGIKTFTGKKSVRDAWLSLIPELKSSDVIGIKLNCINSRFYSHREVVEALIWGLRETGVAENNIIVWDRSDWEIKRCGYAINTGKTGIRYSGTTQYDESLAVRTSSRTENGTRLTTILTRQCDYLINVPVLKDHGTAGVTLSMKNHYGSISNPAWHHGNYCDPYIAYINAAAQIREKTKLIVLDALLGIHSGGPHGSPQWVNRQLLIGTDTVAVDFEGMMMIEQKRLERSRPSILRMSRHIQTAAELELGTNNPAQINLHNLRLG